MARKGRGGLQILGVGRLAAGITKDFANQSELARDLTLASAQHEIRMVQQDLGFGLGRSVAKIRIGLAGEKAAERSEGITQPRDQRVVKARLAVLAGRAEIVGPFEVDF